MLEGQSRALKMWISPSFQKNWAKKWHIGLASRASQSWSKIQKHALFVTSSRENSTPKSNNFVLIGTRRLAESVDGLNTLWALLNGKLWLKQTKPIYRFLRFLKSEEFTFITLQMKTLCFPHIQPVGELHTGNLSKTARLQVSLLWKKCENPVPMRSRPTIPLVLGQHASRKAGFVLKSDIKRYSSITDPLFPR